MCDSNSASTSSFNSNTNSSADNRNFPKWLSKKLTELGVDDDELIAYMSNVLTNSDTREEAVEGLECILIGFLSESSTANACCEIADTWEKSRLSASANVASQVCTSAMESTVEEHLEKLGKNLTVVLQPQETIALSDAERKDKELVLSRFGLVEDEQFDNNTVHGEETDEMASSDKSLFRNTNAESVATASRMRKEAAKEASEKKRAHDKADREQQRAKEQARKEKEKLRTQKGERRR